MNILSYHQRWIKLPFLLLLCLSLFSNLSANLPHTQNDRNNKSHYVLVSVAPYKFFVEAIAGKTLNVGLLVPAGTSFHHFEPTPKQMLAACSADLWFRMGESFETRLIQVLKSHCPNMQIFDLREGLNLIEDPHHACHECCASESSADLHIWLNPLLVKIQVERIAKELIQLYPEHQEEFQKRLQTLQQELVDLDQHIKTLLEPLKNRTIMVSHPAYAYFAKTYNLTQLPIEYEGKDPSPRQLTEILNKARAAKITTIFIQPQHSSKGAYLIAKELNAKVVTLDPYAENYFVMMNEIAKSFAAQESLVSN